MEGNEIGQRLIGLNFITWKNLEEKLYTTQTDATKKATDISALNKLNFQYLRPLAI